MYIGILFSYGLLPHQILCLLVLLNVPILSNFYNTVIHKHVLRFYRCSKSTRSCSAVNAGFPATVTQL